MTRAKMASASVTAMPMNIVVWILPEASGFLPDGLQRTTDQNTETDTRPDDTETDDERHAECLCYFNIHRN